MKILRELAKAKLPIKIEEPTPQEEMKEAAQMIHDLLISGSPLEHSDGLGLAAIHVSSIEPLGWKALKEDSFWHLIRRLIWAVVVALFAAMAYLIHNAIPLIEFWQRQHDRLQSKNIPPDRTPAQNVSPTSTDPPPALPTEKARQTESPKEGTQHQ